MRITSGLFVAALIRRVFSAGGYAAIARRGAEAAGAVFVVARGGDGKVSLHRPAAQASYGAGRPEDRMFSAAQELAGDEALDAVLAREIRFDPDLWVVEIEPPGDDAGPFLTVTTP